MSAVAPKKAGFSLARPVAMECGSQAAAEYIRSQFADCLHTADDARTNTVKVTTDAPRSVIEDVSWIASESWPDESAGQIELTDRERRRIDWERTNVLHARSCKALAAYHDVEDWLAYYDVTLSVDEHRGIYAGEGGQQTLRTLACPMGGL